MTHALRQILIVFCTGIGVLILTSCGTTPEKVSKTSKTTETNIRYQKKLNEKDTPESLIELAEKTWSEQHNIVKRNTYLLQATELYIKNEQYPHAEQILLLLKDSITKPLLAWYHLLQAQIYRSDNQASPEEILTLLSTYSTDSEIIKRQAKLKSEIYANTHQWLAAANSLLTYDENSETTVRQAWQWISSANVQTNDIPTHYGRLQPYLALHNIIKELAFDKKAFALEVNRFKAIYSNHPLVTHWPEEIDNALALTKTENKNLLVMLPLSGRLAATGRVIKEGILSSYYHNLSQNVSVPTITFLDTQSNSTDDLVAAAQQSDWIIGPLLKENIQAIAPSIASTTKMLALNRVEQVPSVNLSNEIPQRISSQVYFALSPEDEAIQLAQHMFDKGYVAPIVVSTSNAIGTRMKTAFDNHWQKLTQHLPYGSNRKLTHVEFIDTKSMREGVTHALDIAQSNDRIKDIESWSSERIYELPRNRRDIDAIVAFANPEQTELLTPLIEASLSPFISEPVPVYATSRSVEYNSSRNQWRDLQNLQFIDMPWMISSVTNLNDLSNNWQPFLTESQTLWPNRSTQMQRLYAFGIDAYNLIDNLETLNTLPQTQITGLSGELSIDQKGQIKRTLTHAYIAEESVHITRLH